MSKSSSQPATHDFLIYEGNTFKRGISLRDADGNTVSLAGITATMDISLKRGEETTDLTLTIGDGLSVVSDELLINEDILSDVLTGGKSYEYDLTIDWPDGTNTTYLTGKVKNQKRVKPRNA